MDEASAENGEADELVRVRQLGRVSGSRRAGRRGRGLPEGERRDECRGSRAVRDRHGAQLYREYRDIVGQFAYVVETERRFYLANDVDLQVRNADGEVYFEVTMSDAWVWDMYRPARFVKNVRVVTFKDVNVEELAKPDLRLPRGLSRLTARTGTTDHRASVHTPGRPQGRRARPRSRAPSRAARPGRRGGGAGMAGEGRAGAARRGSRGRAPARPRADRARPQLALRARASSTSSPRDGERAGRLRGEDPLGRRATARRWRRSRARKAARHAAARAALAGRDTRCGPARGALRRRRRCCRPAPAAAGRSSTCGGRSEWRCARVVDRAASGSTAHLVEVEADLAEGLPGVTLVGLPDAALAESRDRVRAAVVNSGRPGRRGGSRWPSRRRRCRSSGSGFDLALACSVLAAAGVVPRARLRRVVLLGELGLDGRRPRRARGPAGVLAAGARRGASAWWCRRRTPPRLRLVPGLRGARGASTLADLLALAARRAPDAAARSGAGARPPRRRRRRPDLRRRRRAAARPAGAWRSRPPGATTC